MHNVFFFFFFSVISQKKPQEEEQQAEEEEEEDCEFRLLSDVDSLSGQVCSHECKQLHHWGKIKMTQMTFAFTGW